MFLEWAINLSLHATTQKPLLPEADFLRAPGPEAVAESPFAGEPLSEAVLRRAVDPADLQLPTPAELFLAFEKEQRPKWQEALSQAPGENVTNRSKLGALLGVAFADTGVAIEARDPALLAIQLERLQSLASALGVELRATGRINNLEEFAKRNEWRIMVSELEATFNELRQALREQRDEPLVLMIETGRYLRALQIVAQFLDEAYDAQTSRILRQENSLKVLRARLEQTFDGRPDWRFMKNVARQLEDLQAAMTFPRKEMVGPIVVNKANRQLGRLVRTLSSR
jgi:phage gpG-like protein